MKDGRISLQGTPSDVWAADPDLQITSRHVDDLVISKSQDESCVDKVEKVQTEPQKRQKEEWKGNTTYLLVITILNFAWCDYNLVRLHVHHTRNFLCELWWF